jgi:hypothetical protein
LLRGMPLRGNMPLHRSSTLLPRMHLLITAADPCCNPADRDLTQTLLTMVSPPPMVSTAPSGYWVLSSGRAPRFVVPALPLNGASWLEATGCWVPGSEEGCANRAAHAGNAGPGAGRTKSRGSG